VEVGRQPAHRAAVCDTSRGLAAANPVGACPETPGVWSAPMARSALAALAASLLAAGCGIPSARYPADVQTALASHAMRRLETEQLLVYYPEGRREPAERHRARIQR